MAEGKLLAVDFDKTLTDPEQDEWNPAFDQEPNQEVIEAVREAYIGGSKVVIWTARQWSEAPQIAGWLTAHEVPFHGLRCGKGGADKYVDDKTVTPKKFTGKETVMTVKEPDNQQ
jgi:phosphoserine phosphatase